MKRLDRTLLEALQKEALDRPRQRANLNLHPSPDAPVQRFFNALQPGTYVRPHRHRTPPRWELFLVLQGRLVLLVFDDEGVVIDRQELAPNGDVFGVEMEAGTWHCLTALEPSVMFEVKEGPYEAMSDKDFAPWAPHEGVAECADWVRWYGVAAIGEPAPTQY